MAKRSPDPTHERRGTGGAQPDEPIRVVVGAEHAVVRTGLAGIVGGAPERYVVTMVANAGAALHACVEQQPCVAVVDYGLPDLDAPQLVRRMRRAGVHVAVLVVLPPSWEYVSRTLQAGAAAAVSRSAPSDVLLQAVRAVVRGERFVEPEFIERFLSELRAATPATPERRLSDRELQVLTRLAMGWRSKELATALDLSSSTIDSHRRRILRKLGLRTTADLTRFAVRRGLVRLDG